MNKFLLKFSFALLLMVIVSSVNAQTRTATVTGNWNNTATWGGASVPTSVMDVVINSGVTVTINVATAQCNSITFTAGASGAGITISGTNSLQVTGAVVMNGTTAGSGMLPTLITVGTGSFSCGSLAINPAAGNLGSTFRRTEVTVSTGTITVNGNISCSGDVRTAGGGSGITFTGAGILNVAGNFYTAPNFGDFTSSSGTVHYSSATPVNISDFAYNNLTISGSGDKTTIGTTSVAGTLNINAGSKLTVAGFNFTVSGNSSISGELESSSTAGTKTFDNLVINNGGLFNSTVNEAYTLTGNLQVDGTGSITSGTGTWTFSGTGTLSGTGSASINTAAFSTNYSVTGDYNFSNVSVAGAGTVTLTNNGTVSISSTLTGSDRFVQGAGDVLNFSGASIGITTFTATAAGNTVNYTGAAQIVRATTYQNLTLSGSGAKTLSGSTVNETLSIQGTATTTGTTPTYGAAAILEYKGSGAQNTSSVEFGGAGNNPTNLRIDNTNGVTLNAAKAINGALTLTNGYLTTTSALLTINANGSASTSNGAFVNGPLAKIKNTTARFDFPVGSLAGGLRIIGVAPVNTTNTTYTATFNTANPRGVAGGTNLNGIAQISACEYWNLTRSAATNAQVTLSWPAAVNSCGTGGYVGNVSSLIVASNNGSNWINLGQSANTGSPSTGGTVTSSTAAANFTSFVLGTTDNYNNPLPVMFADVKAFQKNSGVQIEWTNLTERDLLNYSVERSGNGVSNFVSVSQVAPRTNNNDKESYFSYDASPSSGVNYYRVKAQEVSGKIIYSKVLKVDLSGKQSGISLYPNPVTGSTISVFMNVKQGQYTVQVSNSAGQQILTQRMNHQGGSITQTVELPSTVKPGVYNIMVTGDNYRASKTFIVQ